MRMPCLPLHATLPPYANPTLVLCLNSSGGDIFLFPGLVVGWWCCLWCLVGVITSGPPLHFQKDLVTGKAPDLRSPKSYLFPELKLPSKKTDRNGDYRKFDLLGTSYTAQQPKC